MKKACCLKTENLVLQRETSSMRIYRCKECFCKHYDAKAEAGYYHFSVEGGSK